MVITSYNKLLGSKLHPQKRWSPLQRLMLNKPWKKSWFLVVLRKTPTNIWVWSWGMPPKNGNLNGEHDDKPLGVPFPMRMFDPFVDRSAGWCSSCLRWGFKYVEPCFLKSSPGEVSHLLSLNLRFLCTVSFTHLPTKQQGNDSPGLLLQVQEVISAEANEAAQQLWQESRKVPPKVPPKGSKRNSAGSIIWFKLSWTSSRHRSLIIPVRGIETKPN